MSKQAKIYISDKVTGLNIKHAFDKFSYAEYKLSWQALHTTYFLGFKVPKSNLEILNPMKLELTEKDSYLKCVLTCVLQLLTCSHIYMLNDWKDSRGARIERRIAKLIGIKVIYQK